MKVVTSLVLVFLSAGICTGHPDGGDDEACLDLLPSHGNVPMNAFAHCDERYHLVQDKEDYKPGDVITVTLSSEFSPFRGFPDQGLRRGREGRGLLQEYWTGFEGIQPLLWNHAHLEELEEEGRRPVAGSGGPVRQGPLQGHGRQTTRLLRPRHSKHVGLTRPNFCTE
uniref:Putative secreted protein n=1 Tax=Ixodes ricinus TaxID=34613 RepID=A0A090X817_IXORI